MQRAPFSGQTGLRVIPGTRYKIILLVKAASSCSLKDESGDNWADLASVTTTNQLNKGTLAILADDGQPITLLHCHGRGNARRLPSRGPFHQPVLNLLTADVVFYSG